MRKLHEKDLQVTSEELMREDLERKGRIRLGPQPNKLSLWYDEEDKETDTQELDEFNEDDITSMAHGKLDEIREMRHYTRLAAWELPLLSSKPRQKSPLIFCQYYRISQDKK